MYSSSAALVIRFGRLGDTLLLQPLLQKLHERFGRPCHLLAVGKCASDLYEGQPDVGNVDIIKAHHRPLLLSPEQWRIVGMLKTMRRVPVYVCEPQPKSLAKIRLLLNLAGVPLANCVFLQDMPPRGGDHWVDRLLAFGDETPAAFHAMALTRAFCTNARAPQLVVNANERVDCTDWLRQRNLVGRTLVLIQPANKRTMRWNGVRKAEQDDKSWPIDSWVDLVRAIVDSKPEAHVLLCGAPVEAAYLESLCSAIDRNAVSVAAVDLPLCRLKALLTSAHSMISVDTGPAHLAAAMGCPLVVLFGAVEPSQWAPRGNDARNVKVMRGPPKSLRVDSIASADVIAAWRDLPLRATMLADKRNMPAAASRTKNSIH